VKTYRVVDSFKRNSGTWPLDKRLIKRDESKEDVKINESVSFEVIRSAQGDLFWVKRYRRAKGRLIALIEREVSNVVSTTILTSKKFGPYRARVHAAPVVGALDSKSNFFLYQPDLFEGLAVHIHDWTQFFSAEECRLLFRVGCVRVEPRGIPRARLMTVCDFQACHGWDGLQTFDFEPDPHVIKLCVLLAIEKTRLFKTASWVSRFIAKVVPLKARGDASKR
jgi:hypothetical protein